jgi:endogenous inhibitor of DNA gyrase (YacG/DUF329 family)
MKCPICKKDVQMTSPEAPFCSERCRIIDLGNWASGAYVIPVPLEEPSETGAEGDPSGEE